MEESKKILLATSNEGKLTEFKKLFTKFDLVYQTELGINDATEDGLTFFENALKKARHGAKESGLYTIADDSGLVVPGLNFEPGIYSARYAGEGVSDNDNRNKIIEELKKRNLESLPAYYVCILVGIHSENDPMPIYASGKIHGKIRTISEGDGGFGYDKIFYPNDSQTSMASITPELKNTISHRAIAAGSFLIELERN